MRLGSGTWSLIVFPIMWSRTLIIFLNSTRRPARIGNTWFEPLPARLLQRPNLGLGQALGLTPAAHRV